MTLRLLLPALLLLQNAVFAQQPVFDALQWRSIGPHRGGRTVGARAWKLEIRDQSGRFPSLARASLRAARAVPSIGLAGLGLLWCLLDREGQSAHDRLSGTQLLEEAK